MMHLPPPDMEIDNGAFAIAIWFFALSDEQALELYKRETDGER